MLSYSNAQLNQLAIHYLDTENNNVVLSDKEVGNLSNDLTITLLNYFLAPFKELPHNEFNHETDVNLNELYTYSNTIFEKPTKFFVSSVAIAKHLYKSSTHNGIKSGEICIVHFNDCNVNNELMDAIGIFKVENKSKFLKFIRSFKEYKVTDDEGLDLKKIDKGCLILNATNQETPIVLAFDNINKGNDAQYWTNDFLNIKPCADDFHHTKNFLSVTKNYVTQQLPNEFEISKADQIDLLNRSVAYFKKHETFDETAFANEVFEDKGLIKSFRKFKDDYQSEHDIELEDEFEISSQAVKKQARIFKSVLKLDKNFHIYIHGNRELIEQGVEKDGRKYYKIYFNEEN